MPEGNNGHPDDDRLIDLALGFVPAVHRAELLTHLEACEACENRFRVVVAERERLKVERPPRAADSDPDRARRPASRGRSWKRFAALAAAAALFALVVFLPRPVAPRSAGPAASVRAGDDRYWMPVAAETVLLREPKGDGGRGVFAAAVEAYRRHDARTVIDLLATKPIPEHYEPLRLILASAYLNADRAADARAVLDRFDLETVPPPWRDRGLLLVAQAAADLGDTQRSAQTRARLDASDDPEVRRRARDLQGRPKNSNPAQ